MPDVATPVLVDAPKTPSDRPATLEEREEKHRINNENFLRTLSLEVREGNERAIALYKRFGFVEVGRHKARINVRGTYYDEILMDLDLTELA